MIYVLNTQEQIMDILEPQKERSYYNDMHVQDLKEGSETFDFTTDVNIPENSTIVLRTTSGDLHPFIVQRIMQVSNTSRSKTYYCDGEFLELRYTRILEPQILTGQTPSTALNFALQGTRWTLGVVDSTIVKDVEIGEYMNVLKYIRMLADVFDLEMRFRVEFSANTISARYVDLVERAGLDMGKEIVFGKDLQSIERSEDTSAIVTALYAVGPADDQGHYMSIESVNSGQKYVSDADALQRWGKDGQHRFDIFTPSIDTKYLTPQILKDLTDRELAKRINSIVTYKVDAVDLYDVLDYGPNERVFLGDTIRSKDEGFTPALYVEARVIRIERSYTDPSQNKFTLGDYVEIDINNYRSIRQVQSVLNARKESWNKAESNAIAASNGYSDTVSEAAYTDAVADAQLWAETNGVIKGDSYSGVSITNTDGFVTVRGDELVRTVMNSTKGIVIQKRVDTISPWIDIFYVDTVGKLYVINGQFSGDIVTGKDAYVGNNLFLGDYSVYGTPKSLYFNGAAYIRGGDGPYGGDITLEADNLILNGDTILTYNVETGFCGIGGMGGGLVGTAVMVGVNFRTKKTYVPSSVSFTTTSSNRSPNVTDISRDGFLLYVNGESNTGFCYWRGTYTA